MPTLQKHQAQLRGHLSVHLRSQALMDICNESKASRLCQLQDYSSSCPLHLFQAMKEPRYSIKSGFLLNSWLWWCFFGSAIDAHLGGRQFDRKTLGLDINKHSSRSHHALEGKPLVSEHEHVLLFLPYISL